MSKEAWGPRIAPCRGPKAPLGALGLIYGSFLYIFLDIKGALQVGMLVSTTDSLFGTHVAW